MSNSALAQLVDDITPASQPVRVCTRGDLVAELRRLEEQLVAAQRDDERLNRTAEAPKIARRIAELEQEARSHEVELVVSSIGSTAWSNLMAAHPPTEAQRKQHPGLDHNPDTFPYAAIAASLGEADDTNVRKLADKISGGQWARLWSACLAVNVGDVSVPFSVRASAVLRGSDPSSTTADPEGSPDPSS